MGVTITEGTPVSATALDALKNHLRITGTAEDTHLAGLIVAATAEAQSYLGCAIVAAAHTEKVLVGRNDARLRIKHRPIDTTAAITIADPNGNAYDSDWFEVRPWGFAAPLTYGGRQILAPGLWTVTYTGGVSVRDDYATVIAPLIAQAITLRAADLYLNRNPRASGERDGDQSITLGEQDPFACIARYRVRL